MDLRMMFDGIFEGKTVFVTGHTGFIGSWLTLWLNSLGAKVIGYSLEPPTKPSMFETLELKDQIIHNIGNIQDFTHLQDCLSEYRPEIVFHLAAQPLLKLSYEKPVETFQTNVMGTVNVLESVRTIRNIRACVVMTSDKCYENREIPYAYKEDDPLGGYDPYSASKGATELVVSSYRRSFFNKNDINENKVGISTIRAGNVIGGGDWAQDRIVSDCIRALSSKKPISIRNPRAIRPWQYVLEPISGILQLTTKMLMNSSSFSGAWNFGPLILNNKNTVEELVLQIISEWGHGEWIDVSGSLNNPHESKVLMLDSSKAMNSLGWFPAYSIKDAIHETISWYRHYLEGTRDMKEITLNQIQNYSKKANLIKNTIG